MRNNPRKYGNAKPVHKAGQLRKGRRDKTDVAEWNSSRRIAASAVCDRFNNLSIVDCGFNRMKLADPRR
jgi:hypothetical protein